MTAEDEAWLAWALRLDALELPWEQQTRWHDMPHGATATPEAKRAANARYRANHLEADRAATRERMRRLRAARRAA